MVLAAKIRKIEQYGVPPLLMVGYGSLALRGLANQISLTHSPQEINHDAILHLSQLGNLLPNFYHPLENLPKSENLFLTTMVTDISLLIMLGSVIMTGVSLRNSTQRMREEREQLEAETERILAHRKRRDDFS